MSFIDYQEYVDAVQEADDAMQKALKVLPAEANRLTFDHATQTFRSVRATLVAALTLKRDQERKGR